jgi:hypothetical protein
MQQGKTFLFTSESVGEGHPDKIWYVTPSPPPHLPTPYTAESACQ